MRKTILLVVLAALTAGCPKTSGQRKGPVKPPIAEKIPHTDTYHGEKVEDPYHWLRNRDDEKVLAYLKAENEYTEQAMRHTKELQTKLFEEMKSRIKETDLTVPARKGDYFYYSRTVEGQSYRIHARKKGSLDADEQVLVDVNELAKGKEYTRLGALEVSPDGKLLAYSVDDSGAEEYTLYFKNIATGTVSQETVPGTYYGVAWANDNRTVYYTVPDEAHRPYQVKKHVLGTDPADDTVVFQDDDDKFHVGVWKSKSDKYVFIDSGSAVTDEVHFLDADDPTSQLKVVAKRRQSVEYDVVHHGDSFYILTNDGAANFRLVKAPVSSPGPESWKDVIAGSDDVYLEDLEVFADYLAVEQRSKGLPELRVRNLKTGDEHLVEMPEPVYSVTAGTNLEYDTTTLRFIYSSFTTPRSVFDYDMKTTERELKKEQPVLGDYDRDQYVSGRTFATASDGTKVPVSFVYKKGLKKDGKNPALLVGYGSYGSNYDVYFSSSRLSLLDRGFVYAIAHIRGGSEMGRQWYENGKFLHKKNTFTDFIASAEHLIEEGYTASDRLAISGGSAGGLLMGAVANMRPDLFEVVVADVPFVDVVNTMMDPSIPLTVIEYEEWGNPNEKKFYDYMKSYSPYDNVKAQAYPNMLITAGLNDPRVQYWEPAKWTAKLRATKTDDNLLILKTNMGAGHGGASGRYDYLKEIAFEYAFILDRLHASMQEATLSSN